MATRKAAEASLSGMFWPFYWKLNLPSTYFAPVRGAIGLCDVVLCSRVQL